MLFRSLLGYTTGVRYLHTHTQLVPELSNDVFLNSNVVQVGGGGVGIVFSGQPFDAGGVRLNYGLSQGIDENGNPTGTWNSWETVKSFGAGVSLARSIESAIRLGGGPDLHLSRYADVSAGMNWKDVMIVLAPASVGGVGSTSARDEGIHARVTPIDGFHSETVVPIRVDLAYGYSVLSYNDDAMVTFINADQASPVTRFHRRGGAAQIVAGRLPVPPRDAAGTLHRALIEGLAPLIAVSVADDHIEYGGGSLVNGRTVGSGYEITLANIYTYRRGSYEDPLSQIDGDTWGWGVGLPVGSFGGVRYDDAHWPRAMNSGLGMVHRSQWTAWLDPIEVWRGFGRRHRGAEHSI